MARALTARTGWILSTAVVFGVAAGTFRLAATAQDEPTPRVAFTVGQARYLSTESAQGSITIDNTTAFEIGYSSLSVMFLIRDAHGRQREDRWIKHITVMPSTTWIPSGEHRTFSVTLPGCEVLSDPCSERVAIKLSLYLKNGKGFVVPTGERSYVFDPDPAATFRVDGLRDNRPLFITQGEARDTVQQNRALLEFRLAGGAPKDVADVVGRIMSRHGLALAEIGTDENDLQLFQVSSGDQSTQAPAAAALDAAIDDIRRQYGARAELVSKSFVPDANSSFDRVFSEAHSAARAAAERLARFVGTAPLSYASGLTGDGTQIQFKPRSDNDYEGTPFVSYNDLVFDASVKARERSPSPGSLDVRVRSTDPSIGARATTGSPPNYNPPRATDYLADGLTTVAPLPVRTTIAADRPQIFAIAATTREESQRLGYDADSVALVLARDRARALAAQLGVVAGNVSLIAQYPVLSWAQDRTLVPFGVAIPMANEPSASWHRLAAPAPAATPLTAPGVARAIVSPTPVAIPTPPRFPGINGTQTPQPDLVPIDVPGPETSLTARGDVRIEVTADELRLSVVMDRGDRTPDDSQLKTLPDSAALDRLLRAKPDVVDVSVQESGSARLPVGYQIVMRRPDLARVRNLIVLLRSKYSRFHVSVKLGISLVLSDCDRQVLRAQQASLDQAVQRAVFASRDEGRRLRRLILAAAYPPDTGDFCLNGAQPDAIDRARDDALRMPDDRSVAIRVPVALTFRTYAKNRQ